jgi:hypothetical protein
MCTYLDSGKDNLNETYHIPCSKHLSVVEWRLSGRYLITEGVSFLGDTCVALSMCQILSKCVIFILLINPCNAIR